MVCSIRSYHRVWAEHYPLHNKAFTPKTVLFRPDIQRIQEGRNMTAKILETAREKIYKKLMLEEIGEWEYMRLSNLISRFERTCPTWVCSELIR